MYLSNGPCNLHAIIPAHMPQQFILLTGEILIPRAKTFLVEGTITKFYLHVDFIIEFYIPEAI